MKKMLISFIMLIALAACRAPDKKTRSCETANTECHENCNEAMDGYSPNSNPYQRINQCDVRCEANFQNCLKRQENRIIKGSNEY